MYTTLSAPMLVQWEVTPGCNHNCLHCYNHWRKGKSIPKLIKNYQRLYQKIVYELINNKVYATIITGGEPLIVIDQISKYIKKLSDNGIYVTMNSNLSLLTENMAQVLKNCGVKSILVSLPSADPKTCDQITDTNGSLNRIIKGVKLAQNFGFPLYINMVVSKINKDQIKETAQLVASLGLKNFSVTRASDPSNGKEFSSQILTQEEFWQMQYDLEKAGKEFNLVINSLEANPPCSYGNNIPTQGYKFCTAGKTTCTIGFKGEVRPCNRSTIEYGNIMDGLPQAWSKMSDWRSDEWIPIECSDCKLKSRCMGGCKADAINAFGDPKRPDPLCNTNSLPETKPVQEIQPTSQTQFIVNPKLKLRKESFGGILFTSINNWVPVNDKLFNLFSQRKEVILLEDIVHNLSTEVKKAAITASFLLSKKIIS